MLRKLLIIIFLFPQITLATTDVFLTPGYTTWIAPANTTSLQVSCWGSGASGSSFAGGGGSGGGGGAFASSTITITPLTIYPIYIAPGGAAAAANALGNNGTSSIFASTTLIAAGGKRSTDLATGGIGGKATDSIGTIKHNRKESE